MFKSEKQTLELVWTVFPTFLVLGLCMFNIKYISEDLDYATDETVKIVGHQ